MTKDAAVLVDTFADSIIKQREAVFSGNTRQVRYYGNKIAPTANRLLQMGEEARRLFATLLQHPDREVRGNAAFFLLRSMPDEALVVFRELAQGDDLIADAAKLRIKQWEESPENGR